MNIMNIKMATSVEEQIDKLQERGIIIQDIEKAREILLDIGYFRLGFYCFPFELSYPSKNNRNHIYKEGTRFEDVVRLYYFDYDLRNILLKYINRIEINFRTYLVYAVSNKYKDSPTWFVDTKVVTSTYADKFETKVYDATFKANPVIKRHHQKHINDKYAPAWKTIEFMTLGSILKLYQNLKDSDIQRNIAGHYGIKSIKIFNNYMETIRVIRNTCAHGGILFDISLPRSIQRGPAGVMIDETRNNLKGATSVISYILKQISIHRGDDMDNAINELLSMEQVSKTVCGVIQRCSGYSFES